MAHSKQVKQGNKINRRNKINIFIMKLKQSINNLITIEVYLAVVYVIYYTHNTAVINLLHVKLIPLCVISDFIPLC